MTCMTDAETESESEGEWQRVGQEKEAKGTFVLKLQTLHWNHRGFSSSSSRPYHLHHHLRLDEAVTWRRTDLNVYLGMKTTWFSFQEKNGGPLLSW